MSHFHRPLPRRRFLKGASALGAVSLALPLLPSMGFADSASYPMRLIVFFSGNGTVAKNWTPQSSGGRITKFSPILAPLEKHKNKLAIVEGLDLDCAQRRWQPMGGFHPHERGLGGILTGTNLNKGTFEAHSGYANGISMDQWLADRIHDPKAIHSAQVGIVTQFHHWRNRETMSYAGANKPVFYENNGSKLQAKLFGDGQASSQVFRQIQERRLSVMDYLKEDLARTKARVSAQDALRLEEHAEKIHTLEKEVRMPPAQCTSEPPGSGLAWDKSDQVVSNSNFKFKQIATALACDRTRVVTMQYGAGLGAVSMRHLGISTTWHHLSHRGDSQESSQMALTKINTHIAERFAALLTELDSVKEGSGTLLDHCLVLWVNELGKGNNHNYADVPIVIAGGLHGKFKTGGQHFKFGSRSTNDLLLTIAHAFGYQDLKTFGNKELCTGRINELVNL